MSHWTTCRRKLRAHQILDAVAEGRDPGAAVVRWALTVLGDLP